MQVTPVQVTLDARWINPEPSGIGVYTRELIARLPRLAPDATFRLLFRCPELAARTITEAGVADRPNVRVTTVPYGVFAPAGQWRLPRALRRWRCDLFHSPNYLIPYLAFPAGRPGPVRCVTTVHDVIPLLFRDHAPRSRKNRLFPLFVACLKQSVRRSDAILTVSEASRRDLVRTLRLAGADAERVRTVYNGAGAGLDAVGRKPVAGAPDAPRTLLYVGRLDPYKNVPLLIEAFAALRQRHAGPLSLKLVGPPDPRYPEAQRTAQRLGVGPAVCWTGFLSEAGLAEAYRQADLLVHPSRYEGFGLQLIEAMRCGLPVVCTDGGAQPEVVGDAAVVVPAGDATALTDALAALLAEPARLEDLQQLGLVRARRFDWEQTASEVLAVYRKVLRDGAK